MTESTRIVLTFLNDSNEKIVLSIPRGNKNLEGSAAMESMEGMINVGIIVTDKGSPAEVYRAEAITTELNRVA